MKKKKIALGLIIFVLMGIAVASFFTTSNGYTEYKDNQRWYYEVVDGEAVNVRIVDYDDSQTTITVPSELGGYPVKSIAGYVGAEKVLWEDGFGSSTVGYLNSSKVNYSMFSVMGESNRALVDKIPLVTEIILPEGLKSIGYGAFYNCKNLETVNIPDSVEEIGDYAFWATDVKTLVLDGVSIGKNAFDYSAIENLTIKNIDLNNDTIFYNNSNALKNLTIGEGVTEVTNVGQLPRDTNVQISDDVETIKRDAMFGVSDVYVNNYKANVTVQEPTLLTNRCPYIHFLDGETISTSTLEGIKIINSENNQEVNEINVQTGSDFTFRLEQDAEHNYENYAVYIETDATFYNNEKSVEKIELPIGEDYTIENITRNKKIYVQERKAELDLNLRQYIKSVNGVEVTSSREPRVEKQNNGTVKFLHTKSPVYAMKNDKITYGIRVYNEGTLSGSVNKITEFIPEGLKFDETSELNTSYNWVVSGDGRSATTTSLSEETINPYTIYNVDYKEIFIDLVVDLDPTNDFVRLVNIAEITEESAEETDSTAGNITGPVDGTYLKEESENSNSNSYILGTEDDNDFENVVISTNIPLPYSLKIKKIDGIDYKLLNGATFDLLDADKNVIKTGVTANGGELDFGTVYTYGFGKTTYYIRETYTPEGYKNHLKYLVQVDIINEEDEEAGIKRKFELDVKDIDIDTSKYKTIAISSKADLMAIESNKDEKYVLTQDIDLGEDWTPLNVTNVKLDGQNHKITGLKLSGDDETVKTWGLFSTYSGIIENLTLQGVDINIAKADEEEETDVVDGIGGFIGYSDGVILKNCKVSGTIAGSLRNVGGLVGHTKSGSILVTRDCTNETTITDTGSNIGGIVGCALGPVKSYNDVNNGVINAHSYNMGGIVGYARQEGYTRTQVFADYNDETKLITIAVKNEAIDGKYQFKISKTDEYGNKLNGAKFQILDRDKQVIPGYEAVEATNGIINFEETRVDCIGNDVYYIKEVEAPEGYLPIENNYIKVVVVKKWDREEEKYYTETTYKVLSNEEYAVETSEAYNTSETKTGSTYQEPANANVQWNIDEVDIENASNEQAITNSYNSTITGGILGNSKGRAMITASANNAEISSSGTNARDAGMAGTIEKKNDIDKAIIQDCSNASQITANAGSYGNASGIVAYAKIDTVIDNCQNEAKISGRVAGSGILGNATGNIEITNCENSGEISSTNSLAAGIFAENFQDISNSGEMSVGNTSIENCNNTANITASSHASGIYGAGEPYELAINNCNVSDCDITSNDYYAAGVVVTTRTEDVKISKCKLDNANLKGKGHVAGIVGDNISGATTISSYRDNSKTKFDTIVEDCDVIDSEIVASTGTAAGMIGCGGYGYNKNISNTILNCHALNTKIKVKTSTQYSCVSGIYGDGYWVEDIDIEDCKVDNCEITLGSENGGTSYANAAGVYGAGYNSNGRVLNLVLNNNEITGTDITNNSPHYMANTSGIMANNYTYCDGSTINISNSKVYNCNINAKNGNLTGVFNEATTSGPTPTNTKLENCIVEKCNLTNENNGTNGSSSITSGLGGLSCGSIEIEKCKVIDSNIKDVSAENTTGILGMGYGATTTIKECEVTECEILSSNRTSDGSTTAGILGITRSNPLLIDNCKVQSSKISGTTSQVGGIMGGSNSDTTSKTIQNCLVDDTEITSNSTRSSYAGATTGGILGGDQGTYVVSGCTISNSSVVSQVGSTGGMVGNVNRGTLSNCKVENVNISNPSNSSDNKATAGMIAVAQYLSISDCSVVSTKEEKATIASGVKSTAGMVGYAQTLESISNCKVENISIDSYDPWNSGTYGSTGALIADVVKFSGNIPNCTVKNVDITTVADNTAGLICGIWTGYGNNANITNAKVEGLNIHHKNTVTNTSYGRNMAGYIGFIGGNIDITESTLKDCTFTLDEGNTRCVNTGGMFAYCGSGKLTIDDTNSISGITISNNSIGQAGGICAVRSTSDKLSIAKLEDFNNININAKHNSGALIGFTYSEMDINDISGQNVSVEGYNYVGGLIGFTGGTTNISDINIENLSVAGQGTIGGILGYTYCSENPTIDTVNITNLTVTNTGADKFKATMYDGSTSYQYTYNLTGGLIGHTYSPIIKNAEITGLKVTSTAADGSTGGLLGLGQYYMDTTSTDPVTPVKISNVTINKLGNTDNVVTGKTNFAGGLVGYSVALQTSGEIEVNDTNVSTTDSGEAAGGIIGAVQEYSSAEDITLSNVSATGATYAGGITGVIYKTDCTFKDIEANGVTASGTDNVGGLVGVLSNANLNNISADGLNLTTSSSKNVGGLIGYTDTLTTTGTIAVANAEISQLSDDGRAGGIIGNVQNYSTIKDIALTNVKITGQGNAGGITAGVYKTSLDISGITVNNVEITTTHTDDTKQTNGQWDYSTTNFCQVGGLVGVAPSATISGVTVNGLTIDNGKGHSGGFIANVTNLTTAPITDNTTITGCTLSDVTVKGRTSEYTQARIGGLIGLVTHPIISDITINNIDVEDKEETLSNNGNTGGIVGLVARVITLSSNNTVESKGEFSNITISSTGTKRNKVKSTLSSSYAGVLTAIGKVDTSDIEVNNIDITGRNIGVIAHAFSGSKLNNITLNNSTVTSTGGQFAAGIVGLAQATELSSCTINNSSITISSVGWSGAIVGIYSSDALGNDGKILSCSTTNVNVTGTGGAIAGIIAGVANGSIEECNVTGGSITTTGIGYVGGIAGIAATITGEVKNCNITNNTTIKSTTGGTTLGGIVGISNKTISGSTLSGATIENAGSIAGGIAGIMAPNTSPDNYKIDNCNVENSTLTTKSTSSQDGLGGIAGISNSPIENSDFTGGTITSAGVKAGGIVGLINGPTGTKITNCNVTSATIEGATNYIGGIAGVSNNLVIDSNFSNGTITSNGNNVGGIVGLFSNTNPTTATATKVTNCSVTSATIEGTGEHIGGIAGFSNNTIEDSTITDSEVKGTGENANAVGGILGHGSNYTGVDASIYNSKVICTSVTGNNQVGGISGGALNTIKDCYVGGKEGVTYTQDEPAVTITGNDSVGGIIGDAGKITADTQMMITLEDNTIEDTKIERNERAKLTGESDDEHKIIGTHNSFGTKIVSGEEVQYTGTQTETITGNTVTNVVLNERTE